MNASDLQNLTAANDGTFNHDLALARQRLAVAIETSGYLRDVRTITLYPVKDGGAVVPGKFWANVKPTDGSKGFRLNVNVHADNGHAFLSFGSCTLVLDLRDADRKAADDAAAAQAQADRTARINAGRAQLLAEAAVRNATPSPGRLLLVHGDVLQVSALGGGAHLGFWHVATVRGSALADGRDAAAAVAENARRREARETVASGEMEGAPSWCDDEVLFQAASIIAADGLNMAMRLEREIKGHGLGGALLVASIGDKVELNGRVFVLGLERGHWVKLLPAVQLLEADETTVIWEGPADNLIQDNREAVGAKRGEVTDAEHAVAALLERGEPSALLGGGASPMMVLRLAPPTPQASMGNRVTVNGRDFLPMLERGHGVKLVPVFTANGCEVVPTGRAYKIPGGHVVDVRCLKPLPNGVEDYRWHAAVCNLRWSDGSLVRHGEV